MSYKLEARPEVRRGLGGFGELFGGFRLLLLLLPDLE